MFQGGGSGAHAVVLIEAGFATKLCFWWCLQGGSDSGWVTHRKEVLHARSGVDKFTAAAAVL